MRISDWSSDVCSSDLLTWNIGATQVIPISFGQLSVHADYAYISRRAAYQNTAADQATQNVKDQYELANRVGIIPAYGLLNARATLNLDNPAMELSRSAEHTSELQSLMRISYAAFCMKKKHNPNHTHTKDRQDKTYTQK